MHADKSGGEASIWHKQIKIGDNDSCRAANYRIDLHTSEGARNERPRATRPRLVEPACEAHRLRQVALHRETGRRLDRVLSTATT